MLQKRVYSLNMLWVCGLGSYLLELVTFFVRKVNPTNYFLISDVFAGVLQVGSSSVQVYIL